MTHTANLDDMVVVTSPLNFGTPLPEQILRQRQVLKDLEATIARARASIHGIHGDFVPPVKTTDLAEIRRRVQASNVLLGKSAPFLAEMRAAQRQMARERRHLSELLAEQGKRDRQQRRKRKPPKKVWRFPNERR